MSTDSGSLRAHQQDIAGVWQNEEPFETDESGEVTPAPVHNPLQTDFDVQNEFWPSSAHELRRTSTPGSLIAIRAGYLDRDFMDDTTSRGHPMASSHRANPNVPLVRHEPEECNLPRVDLIARNSLRETILSTILSDSLNTLERISLLDDIKETAESSKLGIPFRKILSEPMEHLGVSPLLYEIIGCQPDWEGVNHPKDGTGLELVLYLIENWIENAPLHGIMGVCMNVVRTACLRRFDEYEGNRLFQFLRPIIAQSQNEEGRQFFDYDISIVPLHRACGDTPDNQPSNLDFTALISLPHFASRLTQHPSMAEVESHYLSLGKKPSYPPSVTHISVEFLAARRAWRLKVDSNSLALELLDGPGGTIPSDSYEQSALLTDARVKVILPERDTNASASTSRASELGNGSPIELFLPRSSLRPITAAGPVRSEAQLSPCFCTTPGDYNAIRGLDDPRLLHDGRGALLLELTVRFENDVSGFTFINVRPASPQLTESEPEAGPSRGANVARSVVSDDDLYVPSEVDLYVRMNEMDLGTTPEESEWEEISQADETEAKEGGWVKASWSGKDEEL